MKLAYAKRTDDGAAEIVSVLRRAGAHVTFIESSYGAGVPDLLVGVAGRTYLLELKSKKGKERAAQVKFRTEWIGGPIALVRTPEEALAAIGLTATVAA